MARWQVAWTLGAIISIPAAGCGGGGSGRGGAGGSSAGAGGGGGAPTQLDVSVDQANLTIELGTTMRLTITFTASNGFAGTVMLASALNPSGAPPSGWTLTLDTTSVAVPLNGTATTHATLTLPTENRGLAATAKFTATSSAASGTATATTAITVLNQYTFSVPIVNGGCVYPTGVVNITTGSKIRWLNTSTGPTNFIIHSDGATYGCPTDQNTAIFPGGTYECTLGDGSADGQGFKWYCHNPGPDLGVSDPYIIPVPPVN